MLTWKSLTRIISGIRGAYNDINPSTLTGAIDVIVVEQPDGSLKCGPFYVRFGKLTAISPADKVVDVFVNGKFVNFLRMRLSTAGDAYFVDPEEEYAEEEFSGSEESNHMVTLDDSWSNVINRRMRRKIRRDSAMSEPDIESSGIEEYDDICYRNVNFDTLSDCDARSEGDLGDVGHKSCPSLKNSFVSDSQLADDSKSAVHDLQWEWSKSTYRESQECRNSLEPYYTDNTDSSKQLNIDPKLKPVAESEGVYLEDLVTSEVDQDLKKAYIYAPSHPKTPPKMASKYNATNLQSEVSCVDHGYRSDGENSPRSTSPIFPNFCSLKLSLCGGLSSETPISHDKFLENLVSYEDFVYDPESILSNPNLVIELNGRYCNWPMAAPSLISQVAFQTELPYVTLRRLETVHMPKKQNRRISWFSWGTSQSNPAQTTESLTSAKECEDSSEKQPEKVPEVSETKPSPIPEIPSPKTKPKKINHLSPEQLSKLNLVPGRNDIEFRITTKYQGTCTCSASIYYWHWTDKIIVSDVDGTITRSDLLGHLLPMLGHDWTHPGVARLYNRITNNGYKFLYLSARALGQAGITRSYLHQVVQDTSSTLPEGPILLSPNSLFHAFHREVIEKKPEVFKIKCLADVCSLFPDGICPFFAGFGNKPNDVFAYRESGIECCRIFTINPRGQVINEYHPTKNTTYIELGDLVDLYFPYNSVRKDAPIVMPTTQSNEDNEDEQTSTAFNNNNTSLVSFGAKTVDMASFSQYTFWRDDDYILSFAPPESQNSVPIPES